MDLQKGFVPVVKFLVAGLLSLGALFIPIPRYQNGGCLEIAIDPPMCYPAGWKLGPSLWQRLTGYSEQTVSYKVSPSPTPVTDWYPQYGHGQEYEWVAGRVEHYELEGGCYSIVFSQEHTKENYLGTFAIQPQELAKQYNLQKGDFVVLKGKIGESKFDMACPPNIYQTEEIISNSGEGCKMTGCNREICADKDMPSPCGVKLEHGCYVKSRCERQADGKCGWTQTEELKECLNKYKSRL